MQWLRTSAKIAVLMVLSIVAMVAGVQTNVGKKLLVSAVNHGMAGRAIVRGLRGAIPWDMTIAEIELQDPAGTWGRVAGAVQVQHLPKLWMCARLSWAIGGRIDQRHGLAGHLGNKRASDAISPHGGTAGHERGIRMLRTNGNPELRAFDPAIRFLHWLTLFLVGDVARAPAR